MSPGPRQSNVDTHPMGEVTNRQVLMKGVCGLGAWTNYVFLRLTGDDLE